MLKQFMFGAIAMCMAIGSVAVTPVDAASATPNAWAFILSYDQVDAVAAKQINDCAARGLGVAALGDASSDAVSQRPATTTAAATSTA